MKYRVLLIILVLLLIISSMAYARIPGKTFKQNNYLLYTIKSEDTLYSLAGKFYTTISKVKNLNPDLNVENLKIGEVIRFEISPELKIHTVKKGDSLWQISKTYKFPLSQVIRLNNFPEPDYLITDEVVIIPQQREKVKSVLYFIKFTTTSAYLVPEGDTIGGHIELIRPIKRSVKLIRYE